MQIIHFVPGEFHWPPIRRGSCDRLLCRDPPCIARDVVIRTRCVVVYRLIDGIWRRIGTRDVIYEDHLSCGCKTCSDITSRDKCNAVSPCPSTNIPNSFCYWRARHNLMLGSEPLPQDIIDRLTGQLIFLLSGSENVNVVLLFRVHFDRSSTLRVVHACVLPLTVPVQ